MSIKILTLKNGMNVLGDITNHEIEKYIVKQPVLVISQNTSQGPGIGFATFLDFTEEFDIGITIKTEDVLCETTPIKDIYNNYNKIFGSGIQIVSALGK